MINLDEYVSIGTHWITLYVNAENVTHFDCFGVEHIPKEIRKFIGNKIVKRSVYRIQAYDSIMRGYKVFLLFTVSVVMNKKKYLKKKNQSKY